MPRKGETGFYAGSNFPLWGQFGFRMHAESASYGGGSEGTIMAGEFQVYGGNDKAPFSLKIHRGEGMALLAMNWRNGKPSRDFIGFAIEYSEPGNPKVWPLKNRLTFTGNAGATSSGARPETYSTRVAPIQKFRWVHFPRNPSLDGVYTYVVTPVFMAADGTLSYGEAQSAGVTLADETYPGVLNVAFTRGFVSSQAFVDYYGDDLDAILPAQSVQGLTFTPTSPKAADAYPWMGFEARRMLLGALDDAIADETAHVGIVAYDFDLPEVIDRVLKLKGRVRIIIDNSKGHTGPKHAEDAAAQMLIDGGIDVKRQKMGGLQHNKTLYVKGDKVKRVICGSTNMSWRGLYVQSNNAFVVHGADAVKAVEKAFDSYWSGDAKTFKESASAQWVSFGLPGIDAQVTFSPHGEATTRLKPMAEDIQTAVSSVFYSLAFLWQTPGLIRDALQDRTNAPGVFVSGISEKATAIGVVGSSTNEKPVYVEPLDKNVPEPFRSEPNALVRGSAGTRMHHKFVVLDFDTPHARVYLGSYNMSKAADDSNGENLLLVRDQKVATSYMVEALRIIDHYEFRVARKQEKNGAKVLALHRPPVAPGDKAWWEDDWSAPHKIADRELFAR